MRVLFLFFLIIPIMEMLLLFEVSDHIGGLYTVGLVVLTAAIGIQVLKQQGLSTLTRAQRRLESGELPAQEILEGLLLAVGGAFLLTPGFITDTVGFIFLVGPTRRLVVSWLIRSGKITFFGNGRQGSAFTYRHSAKGSEMPDDVYEGEFSTEKPESVRLKEPDDR